MEGHSGLKGGVVLGHFLADLEQDAEGGNHIFLGDQTGDGSHGGLPVAEAQRCKDKADGAANGCQQGVVVVFHHAEAGLCETEALEEPQYDGGSHDDSAGPLDKAPAPLPGGS